MLHKFKSRKIYIQIAIVSAITFLLFLVVMLFSTNQISNTFKKKNLQYTDEIIGQLKQTIYANYNALAKITDLISFDRSVQLFLMEHTEPKKFESYQRARSSLINLQSLNEYILDIIIVDKDGKTYNVSDTNNFDVHLNITNNQLCMSNMLYHEQKNGSIPYFVIGKNVYSTDTYIKVNEKIGSVYLILNNNAFTSTNQSSYQKSSSKIFLFDSIQQPFWSNKSNNAKEEIEKLNSPLDFNNADSKNNLRIEILEDMPISIVSILENEPFIYSIMRDQLSTFALLGVILILIIILWVLLIHNFTHPINKLVSFISHINSGNLSGLKIRTNLTGCQEIEIVNKEFNKMLETIDTLTHQLVKTTSTLYEAEIDKREIEMAFLRSQINPHFLYNTLESIKGIALMQGIPEITNIVKSLATIFKYSIKGDNIVRFSDELKIGKNYLEIQLFRFSDRFDVTYDIDEECMSCMIPKMILQPLIENAIVHGIEGHNEFCHLEIKAKIQLNTFIVTISDDGEGMSELQLKEVQQHLLYPQNNIHSTNGIGIHNINNRIRLIYGDTYCISIESVANKGTTVTIRLPANNTNMKQIGESTISQADKPYTLHNYLQNKN